jgi:hypothetical protein
MINYNDQFMREQTMKTVGILLITLLFVIPANAVVITCVSEGSGVVRIDYSASDETILPIAFALDVTVDGGAIIRNVYDYKVGDSNAASPGYGIFPASMKIDENGSIFDWGSPVDNNGIGTSAVTLAMASRYSGVANAPKVSGTLCRILVDSRGAATVNVKVAANIAGGGVVLQDATAAKFSAVGCTVGGSSPPPGGLPSAPATITYPASSSTGQYTVNWASSTGAASYQVERSSNAGSTWSQVYSGANLSYSETVANGSYRYHVRATNTAGSSGWTTSTVSCVVSITTPPPGLPQVPATIIYPASSSTGQYTVSWASSTGATSYQLERSSNAGSTWTQVYSGANLSYSETVANGSYRYHVRATNTAGSSGWTTSTVSCVVSITTPPPPALPPAPATITYPASSSTGRYTISWASSTGATLYQLQRSNGRAWTQIYSGANRAYSESVGNGSYQYRVRATSTAGTSSWRTGTSTCRVSIRNSGGGDDSGSQNNRENGNNRGSEND